VELPTARHVAKFIRAPTVGDSAGAASRTDQRVLAASSSVSAFSVARALITRAG